MDLDDLIRHQGGLVSRAQVLHAGGDDNLIERRLRRHEWAKVHPGVYVEHTGSLTWTERAWAAVLYYWPAALRAGSALRVHGLRSAQDHQRIQIAVDTRRRVMELPGVNVRRIDDLSARVQPNRSPPRLRIEDSVLDVASEAKDDADAIAVLGDACQEGWTTPARLMARLRQRSRLPRRRLLLEVLDDVAEGTYSVLEHRYLTRVERPHGLPTAKRQRRVKRGRTVAYRDVEYLGLATVVELDGRLGHEAAMDRWDDMDRDIDAVLSGDITVRLGWRHVLAACRAAQAVARILWARGWTGTLTPCSATCPAGRIYGGSPAADAGDPP
jgi:hypothetical protein